MAYNYSLVPMAKWSDPIKLVNGWTLIFDPSSGAIISLVDVQGQQWASTQNPIARFVYRSHSYDEAVFSAHPSAVLSYLVPHSYSAILGTLYILTNDR